MRLGELVPLYLKVLEKGDDYWAKLRQRSLEEVSRYLTRSWEPLHGQPVNAITRQMVKSRRDEIVSESGPVAANRAHAALSGFFAWAIDWEHVTSSNPTSDIKALKQNKRKRTLSEDELVDVWICAGDDDYGRIVKLLMLTGQRREEIGALEWAEIFVPGPFSTIGRTPGPSNSGRHLDSKTRLSSDFASSTLGEPGHSGNAPGDLKPAGSNAKELAPGDQNSKNKKK